MIHNLLSGLFVLAILAFAFVSAPQPPAAAAALVDLPAACGFTTPVTSVTVIVSRDGGGPYTLTNPALLNRLNDAEGLITPNLRGEWLETIRFNPSGATAGVWFYGGSRPFRLNCHSTGLIVRTDDDFFECHLMGVCQ